MQPWKRDLPGKCQSTVSTISIARLSSPYNYDSLILSALSIDFLSFETIREE